MTGSIYRRMGQLLFNFWPYILVSTISAFIFVLLNSASIWLTASFINNVLTDFDKIVQSQLEWASKSTLTTNEKLKYWTYLLILRDTPTESLKVLCIALLSVFFVKNISNLNFVDIFCFLINFCDFPSPNNYTSKHDFIDLARSL